MYRPAFAPSADLPLSEEEDDEAALDRPIQHDLPTTRPLKGRTSIRQKLGSVLARVGSVRKGGSTPPALGTSPREGEDYLSTPQAGRPGLNRRGTSTGSRVSTSARSPSATTPGAEKKDVPATTPTGQVPTLTFSDEDASEEAAYKEAQESLAKENGFSGLVRKLSRSATTGGSAAAAAARARQRALEAEKEAEEARAREFKNKKEAEEYIRSTSTQDTVPWLYTVADNHACDNLSQAWQISRSTSRLAPPTYRMQSHFRLSLLGQHYAPLPMTSRLQMRLATHTTSGPSRTPMVFDGHRRACPAHPSLPHQPRSLLEQERVAAGGCKPPPNAPASAQPTGSAPARRPRTTRPARRITVRE